jgi:hypothetical protein
MMTFTMPLLSAGAILPVEIRCGNVWGFLGGGRY